MTSRKSSSSKEMERTQPKVTLDFMLRGKNIRITPQLMGQACAAVSAVAGAVAVWRLMF